MRNKMNLIKKTVDEKRLMTSVKEISSYHRIQASTGYREAAQYCKKTLDQMGIESRIISYEANPDVWYLQNKMFMEWDLKEAWLKLDDENLLLCDTQAEPMSIIQKSYPVDFTEGVDLVYLSEGNHPEKYNDVDLNGKLIFVRDAFNGYVDWAVKEKGALGIVTDFMRVVPGVRSRNDLYESVNYTSFWWTHAEDEPKTFGFVLSPKMGDQLAYLCEKQKKAFEQNEKDSPYLKVSGKIVSSLYPGAIEVVEAVLPSESEEEVLLCAHLCHPKCSCNDNASGVAASMEVLRVLKYLMENKHLKKNQKTIKLILIPEFTGTYAYLTDHHEKRIAAINLDMVGGRQQGSYGPVSIVGLPYSTPSFLDDLASLCLDFAGEELPNLGGKKVSKTNHVFTSFSGGSDHVIFNDPTIGVPCVMLGQWPDLNYHTSSDTLDVIDPEVLAFSCRTAALCAYVLSTMTLEDVKEIQNKAHVNLASRMAEVMYKENALEQLNHIERFYCDSVLDYQRVMNLDEKIICNELNWIHSSVELMKEFYNQKSEKKLTDSRIFVRDYRGPIHSVVDCAAQVVKSKPQLKKYQEVSSKQKVSVHTFETLIQYYLDGKRTVSEVSELVSLDTECDALEMTQAFVEFLEAADLVHQMK